MGLTGTETVQAKLQFEQESEYLDIPINRCCSDNGVYTSNNFVNELLSKGQGIKHSGFGIHHDNSVAENSIKTTVRTDRTMMIQSALHWPEHNDCGIWPQALIHTAYLHNYTPHIISRLSPTEVCSLSKSSRSALIYAPPSTVMRD